MTYEEKNQQLLSGIGDYSNSKRKIVRIDRIEIGASGWWITYRVGSPNSAWPPSRLSFIEEAV